mgnify:CR=1 FL=1
MGIAELHTILPKKCYLILDRDEISSTNNYLNLINNAFEIGNNELILENALSSETESKYQFELLVNGGMDYKFEISKRSNGKLDVKALLEGLNGLRKQIGLDDSKHFQFTINGKSISAFYFYSSCTCGDNMSESSRS